MSFLGEIKRRRVFQVAIVYTIVAWALVEIVATAEEPRFRAVHARLGHHD